MLKFIMKEKTKDVIHSSAYAQAQNGGNMGAASTQSFAERQKINQNRQRIRGYNDSRVVSQAFASSGVKAKTYTPPEPKDTFSSSRDTGTANRGTLDRGTTGRNTLSGPQPSTNLRGGTNTPPPPMRKNPGISR